MTTNINNTPDTEPDDESFECPNCGEHRPDTDHAREVRSSWSHRRDPRVPSQMGCDNCCDRCADCGAFEFTDDAYEYRGDSICRFCFDSHYTLCDDCEDVVVSDEVYYPVIGYDRHGCEEHDYDVRLCENCFELRDLPEQRTQYIHSYSFRPAPVFRRLDGDSCVKVSYAPTRDLYMGFELETNEYRCGDIAEAAQYIMANSPTDYLYLKEDGSISGFEIVSHPATFEAHMAVAPFEAFERLATDFGMSAWRGGGCGLHVHLSKRAFSQSHMMKFMMFHELNADMLKRFAGRDSQSYASFDNNKRERKFDVAKGDRVNSSRYSALNFQNDATVELRYFRGSLKPVTVKGVLEMCQAMYDYTRNITTRDIINRNALAWDNFRAFVVSTEKFENLPKVFEQRGLN
ncbi:MAG: hypothetical protein EBS70_01860 [Actinobacteria bacterium]|jgi:hypothetical protein|nr:hypothetical protein [Actinomycetota bacterium]